MERWKTKLKLKIEMKEDIKITSVSVFVNPYTELDEEEEKAKEEENKIADDDHDKVGSWFSNPGTGASGVTAGGGVGKYLKARNTTNNNLGDNDAIDSSDRSIKKRKVDASTVQYNNFSGW